MKKFIAAVFACISGVYLVFLGWIPDPLPIIDEATALIVFVKSMAVLGIDLTRFIPFLGKRTKEAPKGPGPVVDV